MQDINITEFRNHLPHYMKHIIQGHDLVITAHGKAIARITPIVDTQREAKQQLLNLQKICKVGDVVSPIDEVWEAS